MATHKAQSAISETGVVGRTLPIPKYQRAGLLALIALICGLYSGIALSEIPDAYGYVVSAGGYQTCALDDNGVTCWGRNQFGQSTVPTSLVNPRQVSAGSSHTCALDDNGVTCWGYNISGQTTVPAGLVNPRQVAAGRSHTCALDDNGVTCWGGDYYGQSTVPAGLVNPRQVTVGDSHTCALDDNGVTCRGYNEDGQSTVPAGLVNPRQVSAGYDHTCALDDNGVTCWGRSYGQSTVVAGLVNPRQVSAGSSHTCALDENGVTCWRYGAGGQSTVPAGLVNPRQVSAGSSHTCALDDNGVTCWGWNNNGQSTVPNGLSFSGVQIVIVDADQDGVGDRVDNCPVVANGDQTDTDTDGQGDACDNDDDNDGLPDSYENKYAFLNPLDGTDAALDQDGDGLGNLVEFRAKTDPSNPDTDGDGLLDGVDIMPLFPSPSNYMVTAGYWHTCALDDNGVTCWGAGESNNGWGQSTVPAGLVNPRQVTAGRYHTCALDDNGVTCWGDNRDGQSTVPAGLVNPRQVTASGSHTCALDDNGVTCWGRDTSFQSTVPAGLVNPRQVTAGDYHTCALDDNGVACWGGGVWWDQTVVRAGLVNPRQVAAGYYHTCALDDNGVTCWGRNSHGQSTVPASLVNPRQVTAGRHHTCALDDNGVTCWGWDYFGQSTVPAGLVNPRQVSAGLHHTCAMDDNGVTCWGENGSGQSTAPGLSFSRLQNADNDFGGDGKSDVLIRNQVTNGWWYYPLNGRQVLPGSGPVPMTTNSNWQPVGIGDFNGDGKDDVMVRHQSTYRWAYYPLNGRQILPDRGGIPMTTDANWQVAGIGDFNGDGKDDVLVRHQSTYRWAYYPLNGRQILPDRGGIPMTTDANWQVAGIGDFNGDGKDDVMVRHQFTYRWAYYPLNGRQVLPGRGGIPMTTNANWQMAGIGDFNGDNKSDVLVRNQATQMWAYYPLNGRQVLAGRGAVPMTRSPNWQLASVGDFNGDGKSDVLVRNQINYRWAYYPLNGRQILPGGGGVPLTPSPDWVPVTP